MDILGIGASELIFIIIIALIVLGPKDMQKAGKTIGRWLNQLVRSDGWKVFQKTSREMRNLPTNLMREANMDLNEAEKDIRKAMAPTSYKPLASSPSRNLSPSNKTENSIQSPTAGNDPESTTEISIQPPPPFAEPTETPDSPATGNDPESTIEKND